MIEENYSQKIKNFLLGKNLITTAKMKEVEAEIRQVGIGLEEALINRKIFSPERFAQIKGEIFNIESVNLADQAIEPSILNILTPKVTQNYQMVVFDKQGNEIKVGLVNPGNFQAHEAIEFLVQQQGLTSKYYAISLEDFRNIFKQYGDFNQEIGSALKVAEEKFVRQEEMATEKVGGELENIIKVAPVAKIVSVIIKHAVDGGASDIHIEPGRNEARVRYRVDGILHTSLVLPNFLDRAVISRIKVLSSLKLDETRIPQDGRIKMNIDGQDIDLRVSILPMLDAEKVMIRILDNSAGVPTLAELGFSRPHIEIIEKNIKKSHGLFLLTGPTGSGKTTTLYSILNMLNSEDLNISTLEDPVEYYTSGINQSQIRPDIGFTFASGLRAVLRQDPNIIMVGEIRDNETAELAIHAALTGHLIFSTLHTNNAWGSIPRLIDMKIEPFFLASTLNTVIAQRLVRKICPDCKAEIKLPPNLQNKINERIKEMPPEFLKEFKGEYRFYRGRGCDSCGQSGYIGRSIVAELLEMEPALKDLIASDFTRDQINNQLKKQKYITLIQDGLIKALKGVTTIEEAMRVATE
ncbi:type II/IV secretion system protein [Candidatus Falkowbacteria bacterium]|nr:type II/IV secretion system protein [Candidatus Falkowbacteria bacterium]